MALRDLDYTGVSMKSLPEHMKDPLREWRMNLLNGTGKQGLWIFGPRGAGTTFAAQVIVKRMVFEEEGFLDSEHIEAIDLVTLVRATWDVSIKQRDFANDFALFLETQGIEDRLDYLFYRCTLLWVDDLHHDDIDWNLWRKHVQPFLERRAKHRMPTVVSTTLPPIHDFLPAKVIDTHFITILCDGER